MTIRSIRLPLLLLLEILWGWPLAAISAQLFSAGQASGPSIIAVVIVVLGSAAALRLLQQFELDDMQTRVIGVASIVAVAAVVLPLEFSQTYADMNGPGAIVGAMLVVVGLWVRGVLRNRDSNDFSAIARSVCLGIIPVAIAAASQPHVNGPAFFGEIAVVYVPLGLLVLVVHHAAEPGRPARDLAAQWGPVALAAVLTGGLLAVIAAAIDPDAFLFLAPLSEPLRDAGRVVAMYTLGPIFAGLSWLFGLLPEANFRQPPTEPMSTPEAEPQTEKDRNPWSIPIGLIANIGIVVGIVLLVLAGLALFFHRLRRKPPELDEEAPSEREGSLRDDIADLFGALGRRFRRGPREDASAVAIRRLYAEMIEEAESAGIVRGPGTTPSTFAPALAARYGQISEEITEEFVASRYGLREIESHRVTDLQRRWSRRSPSMGFEP